MQTFKILKYKDFSNEKNRPDLSKTINFLQNGDFKSADSKKLVGSAYFRAKIDYTNRLIFTFLREKEETYIALLEVILNHDYHKSKFLRDNKVELEDFVFEEEKIQEILLNPQKELRYLDKIISFSDEQENILILRPPLLIIGSAGSGKTSVAIEKLKELSGKVLYISLSKHLVKNSKAICGEKSNIDFYSFDSFLNTIEKQDKKKIDFNTFKVWAFKNKIRESEKYFEEFKGVLTANYSSKYLLEDEYVSMGIKQSLFKKEERIKVYKHFINYLKYLEESNFYDANIVIFDLLDKIQKVYDFIIIDEVQDFTNKEIYFISQSLKNRDNIIFSGDSNQIIYSNFFSWSNLKTMLFDEKQEIVSKILTQNYRNSQEITKLSKESNYLIDSSSKIDGHIRFYKLMPKNIQDIRKSKDFAIIVFDENAKIEAKKVFNTELTFTVREAKGLEYKNIILYNFITNHSKIFFDIVKDISKEDLESDLKYNRPKDKENRDLESYKIIINSLYVALTRGIESLYILESKNHRLLELLEINKESKEEIEVKESTKEEWLEEAKRLKELGKVEQAKGIEDNINLKIISPKDSVKDLAYYEMKLFGQELFKLAKKENDSETIEILAKEIKFSSAMKYLNMKDAPRIFDYVAKGDISKIQSLIEYGSNIDIQNFYGQTALMYASENGNKEIVKFLLENGADIHKTDDNRRNSLRYAHSHSFSRSSSSSNQGIINLLIDEGADFNDIPYFTSDNIISDLSASARNGDKKGVELLIKNGVNINIQNNNGGDTALLTALKNKENDIAKLLIENGADIDIANNDETTTLMIALENKNEDMVKLLINNGVNVNIQDYNKFTALMIASRNSNEDIIKLLIENGANINLQNINGLTALFIGSEYGNKEIVKILLKNGADSNIRTYGFEGTPLGIATVYGYIEIIKLLIEYGSNINLKTNKFGLTALSIAYKNDNQEIVKLLKENGAK